MPRVHPLKVLLVFIASLLIFCACSGSEEQPASSSQAAPDFTLRTLDGASVQLSQLRGKVVFVNLWATWCPPCRQEIPTMIRFYEQFRNRGVEILAVSEDSDPEAVRKMIAQQGISFPVLMDENKRVYAAYQATGVPETHLIDRNGVIRASQLGPFDWTSAEVVKAVEDLLAR